MQKNTPSLEEDGRKEGINEMTGVRLVAGWWLVTYVAVCLVAAGTTIAGTAVMVIGVDVWPMFSALGYVKCRSARHSMPST